jgi:transcriptional regulator with XRE-family HTH domain
MSPEDNHMALTLEKKNTRAIDEIRLVFGLSVTRVARLFGVSRQAVDKWRLAGVPASRMADVDRVLEIAQVFKKRLKAERIPQIVATPAKGLDGSTVLEVLESRGPDPIFRYLHALYSYAGV